MSNAIAINNGIDLEKLVIHGDLSTLTKDQKVAYYYQRCKEHGLSAASKPFEYIKLNGKEVLYATKGCAEQLRSINNISIKITKADKVDDIFVVIAEAKDGKGREDSATGAVNISGLKGESLANAMMKAETKAKRRVTLSICGLNMLDETEVDSITENPYAAKNHQPTDGDGFEPNDGVYRINFGQWNKKTIEEVYRNVGPEKIASYIAYLEDMSAKKGKPLGQDAITFIKNAEAYLGEMENGQKA